MILFIAALTLLFIIPKQAQAIVPPEVIYGISAQMGGMLALAGVFCSSLLFFLWRKAKKTVVVGIAAILLFTGAVIVYRSYSYRVKRNDRLKSWSVWGKKVASSYTGAQLRTYETNRAVIDDFLNKVDDPLRTWMKDVTITILTDLNSYLVSRHKQPLVLHPVRFVDSDDVKEGSDSDRVVLDVREDYERKFILLDGTTNIRLGTIINDGLPIADKNKKIVVVCNTDARSFIAANYLMSLGYKRVYSYSGGVIGWQYDKLPSLTLGTFKFVYNMLPYLSDADTASLKKNPDVAEILFAPYENSPQSVNSMYMSMSQIDSYINSLPDDKRYIIRCVSNQHCFDASAFLDRANALPHHLNFIGYTGYRVSK